MNIKVEKKKYTQPSMKLVQLTRVSNLLSSSEYSGDDNGVDVDDFGEGYDDEFG